MIDYSPLFKCLNEKEIALSHFREKGLNSKTQARINKGQAVSLSTIEFLCKELDVPIECVVRIIRD
ncbi:XRE family transcriptional regulator [Bacillus licheniformis]|jgi:DNA-binding Xre family transcriptional regulator|nr:hypothetical protein B37_00347 [Bacillus licheniformis]AYQ17721.1 XRE family transcriptional regulator [Bacillus paralicheniformis]ARW41537.1 hypothetical protein S100141_00212 [Bacillus licheniformis]ARW53012.1 hypothetical protein S100027_01013 [Bacillus licheniformis]AWV40304.1 XRE family transcriptional regulator [Bacillus licheniformis]